MEKALQKQKVPTIYRCNTCKLRYAQLKDMAFSENGLMCPYCYNEYMSHKDTLLLIARTIWMMKLELDKRSRERKLIEAHRTHTCVSCGGTAVEFGDDKSIAVWQINGTCRFCQDFEEAIELISANFR